MMKKIVWSCVIGLALCSLSGCKQRPVWNTGRVEVRATNPDHMHDAILQALRARRWAISKDEPGRIEATLLNRAHMAKIAIEYDAGSFSISYVDSNNLLYEKKADGTEVIHKNYNGWINNLVRDISVIASYAQADPSDHPDGE